MKDFFSATSIVTDALLLLAGSPQKYPPKAQSQLDHSASVLTPRKQNPVTPRKKKTHTVQERSASDNRPSVNSLSSQASLISSTFPYVRALDFNLEKVPQPVKRGREKGNKPKQGAKQKATTNQNKVPLTNKAGRNNKRHLEASKLPLPSSKVATDYRNAQVVLPSTVAKNIYALPNCSSVFNRSTNLISCTVSPVVPSACSNTRPYCDTLPPCLPASISSPAIRSSLMPGNLVKPSVPLPYVNPQPGPTSSLVTLVNSISGPENFTSAVTSQSLSPVNHTSLGNSPGLVNTPTRPLVLPLPL